MKQRAKVLIEFPDDYNVGMLEKELLLKGCRVEIEGVFLPIEGFEIPDGFLFRDGS